MLPPAKAAASVPDRTATVDTPLYRAEFGSNGGAIKAWELDYRGQKPLAVGPALAFQGIEVGRPGMVTRPVALSITPERLKLTKDAPTGDLTMVGEDGFGLQIAETLVFHADTYVVDQVIKIQNKHTVSQSAEVLLPWTAPLTWPKDQVVLVSLVNDSPMAAWWPASRFRS